MQKKLSKSQIDNKFRQAAIEYDNFIQMKFEDLCYQLEEKTDLDEDTVRDKLGEMV